MRLKKLLNRTGRRSVSFMTALIMAALLLTGMAGGEMKRAEAAAQLENPLGDSEEDDSDDSGDDEDYDEDDEDWDDEDEGDDGEDEDEWEVGDEFTISSVDYEVTKLGSSPEVKVVGYEGKKKALTIKNTITDEFDVTYKVTSIAESAFEGSSLTDVKLGSNVTKLEARAFAKCKKLRKVVLDNNLQNIGNSAFTGCTALKKVVIPAKVTEIGKDAFNGCKSLNQIQFKGTKVPSFGANCFKGINKKAVFKTPKKKKAAYTKKLTAKTGKKSSMKVR